MTTQTRFTPGPWSVEGGGICALVRGADGTIVAIRHRLPRELNEANMRLIAAAPDLYAALESCADAINRAVDFSHEAPSRVEFLALYETAMAALRKARGEA